MKRQLPVVKEDGQLDQDVMDRLNQMTFTEPFVAARLIHARIQTAGVTPERLAALVRTYANLGMLTEFHWNSANKAFKARALLTAQRMVVDDPRSPMPRWLRAYAAPWRACTPELSRTSRRPRNSTRASKTPVSAHRPLLGPRDRRLLPIPDLPAHRGGRRPRRPARDDAGLRHRRELLEYRAPW